MSQTRVTDPEITPAVWREMGLSDNEYEQVKGILGRNPTYTELGMYAVMWSEHCGYKYSRPVLRLFKRYREQLDSGALENAGVVDIGDGYGIAMKIESHNHPSAVEPFQGAATGVGGILRDIFTMGARPIASLNSLRFGDLDDPHVRFLFEHVVAGIGFYGNCVGVPTVGGEVCFDKSYAGNPLVNAMSAGLVKLDSIASASAHGPGNSVMIVGSRTGRDGIHGATFASVELGPDSESKRPNVQMGDPFTEKLLIEATLAVVLGTLAGLVLARFGPFKGRTLLSGLTTAPLVMPEVITGLSLLLLFVTMEQIIGWPAGRGMTTIVISHITLTMAFVTVVVQSRKDAVLAGFDALVAEQGIAPRVANPLRVTLSVAATLAERDRGPAARVTIGAFRVQVGAALVSRKITRTQAQALNSFASSAATTLGL